MPPPSHTARTNSTGIAAGETDVDTAARIKEIETSIESYINQNKDLRRRIEAASPRNKKLRRDLKQQFESNAVLINKARDDIFNMQEKEKRLKRDQELEEQEVEDEPETVNNSDFEIGDSDDDGDETGEEDPVADRIREIDTRIAKLKQSTKEEWAEIRKLEAACEKDSGLVKEIEADIESVNDKNRNLRKRITKAASSGDKELYRQLTDRFASNVRTINDTRVTVSFMGGTICLTRKAIDNRYLIIGWNRSEQVKLLEERVVEQNDA